MDFGNRFQTASHACHPGPNGRTSGGAFAEIRREGLWPARDEPPAVLKIADEACAVARGALRPNLCSVEDR